MQFLLVSQRDSDSIWPAGVYVRGGSGFADGGVRWDKRNWFGPYQSVEAARAASTLGVRLARTTLGA